MFKGLSTHRYIVFSFVSLLSVNLSFAAAVSSHQPIFLRGLQPVLTFTTGASISPLGQSQSFAPLDLCRYTYKSQGSQTRLLWGGFIGSEVKRSPSWGLTAGLGYYQPNALLSTKGLLTQGADPESDSSYTYRYQTQSEQLLAEGRLAWVAKEKIQPFLMLGVGASFNKTSHYQTSVPPFLEFTPTFNNHTQSHFTYAVGPGIDIILSKSLRIGMAYRFTDLGSANTGRAQLDAILISSTLKLSHLYANQILAQFTFIPWTRD
jgi:opacity protein-like surface antigen